jgi:hypothetical protein
VDDGSVIYADVSFHQIARQFVAVSQLTVFVVIHENVLVCAHVTYVIVHQDQIFSHIS